MSEVISRVQVTGKQILAQVETQEHNFEKLAQFAETRAENDHDDNDEAHIEHNVSVDLKAEAESEVHFDKE